MKFQKPKGTQDIFGKNAKHYLFIKDMFFNVASKYDYSYLEFPIFENVELFKRSSGDSSDIVKKELYEFKDKGDRALALRPEGTASALRAIIESKVDLPQRVFYFGPMFRYERPQAGRYRQFYQGGIEVVGNVSQMVIFDILLFAIDFLKQINITKYELQINHIGSKNERQKYNDALRIYFEEYKNELETYSLERLENNPIRILDDKVESKKDFVKNAPLLENYLSDEMNLRVANLMKYIKKVDTNIDIKINNKMVRGLDYYEGIVFEFIDNSNTLGAQSTILGGGEYNGLMEQLGGQNVPGVGFAFGLERLMELIKLNDQDETNYVAGYAETDEELINLYWQRFKSNKDDLNWYIHDKTIKSNKAFNIAKIKNASALQYIDNLGFHHKNKSLNIDELKTKDDFKDEWLK